METIEHKERVIAGWFYTELQKLDAEGLEPVEAIWRLNSLLERMILERTSQERLAFSTMFARMAYVFQRHEVPVPVRMNLHYFRQQYQQTAGSAELAGVGLQALAHGVRAIYRLPWPTGLAERIPEHLDMPPRSYEPASFEASLRVLVEGVDTQEELLLVRQAERPEQVLRVRYNEAGRNELFNQSIRLLGNWIPLPVEANLLDVEMDQEGLLHPRGFVWCPDYLMDVSAVAECFNGLKPEPLMFLLNKFSLPELSKYLVQGHIANFFLDELMSRPEASFAETFPKVFQLAPLSFCLLPEAELREIQQRSQRHFLTLKEMVQTGFKAQDIDPAQAWLEPSFYSARHGLQGRLDVFYHNGQQAAIVELKSGSAYMPNAHRIGKSHFVQTLLYDLLIRAVYGNRLKPLNYILYSREEREALRYAPRETWMQYEALELRNHLIAIEQMLIGTLANDPREPLLKSAASRLFRKLSPEGVPRATGFAQRNLQSFAELWQGLSSLEQKYWVAFSGFIAREQQLAKTGVQGLEGAKGQASLWLNSFEDKDAGYEIMAGLELEQNRAAEEQPELVLRRSALTNPLANFRAGDIVVLYPAVPDCRKATALEHQLIKGSVVCVDAKRVTLRLRSKQFLTSFFDRYPSWNLEHDLIDSSFRSMYQSLREFAGSPRSRRDLLLGLRAPAQPGPSEELEAPASALTDEQQRIFRQLTEAPEYFLLWGPPGTGKTSVMLKALVEWLLNETQEQVLLLAYTNRAVDEICESIERIGSFMRQHYLRIGSSNSTPEVFQAQLFQQKIAGAGSRKGVLDILSEHRLVVGTVASLGSKQELFRLKKFDRIIIDEASQILEPMLCGLLLRTPKFVLIGDHLQLPAVVTQDEHLSAVADAELQGIGLGNLRNSLFERLYKRCQQQGWHWAYAQLSRQGRMHQEIMDFPNQHFYGGTLQCLPEGRGGHARQVAELDWVQRADDSPLLRQLASRRVLFLSTPADDSNPQAKTNRHEAELILTLIRSFRELYRRSGKPWLADTLGVITPYRAQIAQIQDLLASSGMEEAAQVTVDTVERYQGGARDIILISLCTNRVSQLNALSSLSEEGIDRKLNVALTRAREQLVLLGNPEMLEASAVYRALVERYGLPSLLSQ